MGVERFARKSFGPVVALLLGLAVYFQASGTVELVAAHVLSTPPAAGPKTRRSRAPKVVTRPSATSGDPILARNAFDSVTGPLDREAITVTVPETTHSVDVSDPLRAPECEDVLVNIVTESPDPEWSLAQLKGPGDTDAATRRVGDAVGKMKVAFIGYNAVKASPAVWLVNDEKICQAFLFSEKHDKAAAASGEPTASVEPTAPPPTSRAAARRGAPALPAEIADKIQKVSETEFNVDRSVIDNILENQASLMRSARIVPEQKDGKTVGIRLFGIRADTLLGSLGMQNGDRLEKINGFDVASPEKALEAYARLRTADKITAEINRRGKPLTLGINIK